MTPVMIGALSATALLALAAIVAASSESMNSNIAALQAIQVENARNQETLELVINNDILTVENKIIRPVVVKEIRVFDSGTLTTSITATISGDSQINNYKTFTQAPPPPPAPARKDPLTAWVDVYRNGDLVKSQQIYFNSIPSDSNAAGVTGMTAWTRDEYHYPQTVVSGVIQVSVLPGDFVEYYVYAKIHADGSEPTVPAGYIETGRSGNGYATATIHSGSILSS